MSQRRKVNKSAEEGVVVTADSDAVKECVRYIYSREAGKIPIKRADIHKHLSTVCQTAANKVNVIISEANAVLKRVYGYKLVQVEAKSGVQYIVVQNEECPESVPSSASDPLQHRLLTAALTHIYMSGGTIKEEELWSFLCEAGLLKEDDIAAKKNFVQMSTKQLYLTYSKVGDSDLGKTVVEWGQRATEEMPKVFLLNKVAEALEKPTDYWSEQFKAATSQLDDS